VSDSPTIFFLARSLLHYRQLLLPWHPRSTAWALTSTSRRHHLDYLRNIS
jgi:hypothetical protein